MQIQVYLDGHEWLARKLTANSIRYTPWGYNNKELLDGVLPKFPGYDKR